MVRTVKIATMALVVALASCSTAGRAVIEDNVHAYTSAVAEAEVQASGTPWIRMTYGEQLDVPASDGRSIRDGLEHDGRRYCEKLAGGLTVEEAVEAVWADRPVDLDSLGPGGRESPTRAARLAAEILCPAD